MQARGYDRVGFTWSTRERLSHADTSLFLCCQMMFTTFLNLSCLPCTIISVDLFLVGDETPVRPRMHTWLLFLGRTHVSFVLLLFEHCLNVLWQPPFPPACSLPLVYSVCSGLLLFTSRLLCLQWFAISRKMIYTWRFFRKDRRCHLKPVYWMCQILPYS